MINIIKSDLYRLMHKKSNFVFIGVLVGLYALFSIAAAFKAGGFQVSLLYTPSDMMLISLAIMDIALIVLAIQMFICVYADDISSRRFANILGSGKTVIEYTMAKIVTSAIYSAMVMLVLGIVFVGHFGIMSKGFSANGNFSTTIPNIINIGVAGYINMVIYGMFGMLFLFLTRKITSSVVMMSLIIFQIPGSMMKLIAVKFDLPKKPITYMWDIIADTPFKSEGIITKEYLITAGIYLVCLAILIPFIIKRRDLVY